MSGSRLTSTSKSFPYLGNLPNGDVVFCVCSDIVRGAVGLELWSEPVAARAAVKLGSASVDVGTMSVVSGQLCATFTALFLPDANYLVRVFGESGDPHEFSVVFNRKLGSASAAGVRALLAVGDALDALVSAQAAPPAPVRTPELSEASPKPAEVARPDPNMPPKPSFQGSIDGVIETRIEGWFWNASAPELRYEIQAWCLGQLVGYGLANRFRPDLQNKGKGDGRVKFEVSISPLLQDTKTHVIQLMVLVDPSSRKIVTFGPPVTFQSKNVSPRRASPLVVRRLLDFRQALPEVLSIAAANQHDQYIKEALAKLMLHAHEKSSELMGQVTESVLALTGQSILVELLRAVVHEASDQPAMALSIYKKAGAAFTNSSWLQLAIADSARLAGNKSEALDAYRQFARLSPQGAVEVEGHIRELEANSSSLNSTQQSSPEGAKVGVSELYKAVSGNPDNRDYTKQLFQAQLVKSGNRFNLSNQVNGECAELRHWRLVLESKIEQKKNQAVKVSH